MAVFQILSLACLPFHHSRNQRTTAAPYQNRFAPRKRPVRNRKDGSGKVICVRHELALQPGLAVYEEYPCSPISTCHAFAFVLPSAFGATVGQISIPILEVQAGGQAVPLISAEKWIHESSDDKLATN